MKIAAIVATVGAFLYLVYHQITKAQTTKPIVMTKFTPTAPYVPPFFRPPAMIIQNAAPRTPGASRAAGLTTGPTYAQAGIQPDLPLTPVSPSLLVPLNGDPIVTSVNDINSGLDYPGIQSYMIDPNVPDTNMG